MSHVTINELPSLDWCAWNFHPKCRAHGWMANHRSDAWVTWTRYCDTCSLILGKSLAKFTPMHVPQTKIWRDDEKPGLGNEKDVNFSD